MSEGSFLVHKRKEKRAAHLWIGDANDTACRMYSTGGIRKDLYEVVEHPGSRGICTMCMNAVRGTAPVRYVTITCTDSDTHERQEMQSNCPPPEAARLLIEGIATMCAKHGASIDVTIEAIREAHRQALGDEVEFSEMRLNG